MSEIKVNLVTPRSGTTVTLGEAGDTIALGACASATGFGITGITWCTTAKTAAFCAAGGSGYLVNTTATAFTATLPASPTVGTQISFVDFAGTFDCNALTIGRNSKKIKGGCCDATVSSERGAVTIIYTGTTQGWITTSQAGAASMSQETFITATGGDTTTTCGDYKMHKFLSTGPLNVTGLTCCSSNDKVSYLVVAGGGGGPGGFSAGGGAGGYREGKWATDPYTASPLAGTPCSGLTVSVQDYTITVGGGGTAGGATPCTIGGDGTASVFSTITSAEGGHGGIDTCAVGGGDGGSGGGSSGGTNPTPSAYPIGSGNTPCVSPPQGNNGGAGTSGPGVPYAGGGGGGATAVGTSANTPGKVAGSGGCGATTHILDGTAAIYAGGGGAGWTSYSGTCSGGAGGPGGGGAGAQAPGTAAVAGGANTGGGGGGKYTSGGTGGGAGGSGIVIVRYKYK
jgi:hypothetical protein